MDPIKKRILQEKIACISVLWTVGGRHAVFQVDDFKKK